MMLDLDCEIRGSRDLTIAVLQITQLLGLYHAELARILGLQCGEVGALSNGRTMIGQDTPAWHRAMYLVRLYRALYRYKGGDSVTMCHWMRKTDASSGRSPFLMIVDDGKLVSVVRELEQSLQSRSDFPGGDGMHANG